MGVNPAKLLFQNAAGPGQAFKKGFAARVLIGVVDGVVHLIQPGQDIGAAVAVFIHALHCLAQNLEIKQEVGCLLIFNADIHGLHLIEEVAHGAAGQRAAADDVMPGVILHGDVVHIARLGIVKQVVAIVVAQLRGVVAKGFAVQPHETLIAAHMGIQIKGLPR